jgi:acetolactate synthase I/II/III large subunit
MPVVTGGSAIVERLRVEGVTHVFGLIGSAGMEIFDALYNCSDIRFIGVRDERTGTHMADGYSRASGRAGVFLAGQNGPGATNTVTGLAQAYAAYSPVVMIAGSLSSAHTYRDAFQEVDQLALFRPVTKNAWTVTQAARIPEMVGHAFRTALAPRRGPVALNVPRDLLASSIEVPFRASTDHDYGEHVAADEATLERAVELLTTAERAVILAGAGVKSLRGQEATIALAEKLGVPVAMSPGHGDAIPGDHRVFAGQAGPRGNAVASDLLRQADVILALGTRLGFNTTFYSWDNLNPNAKIIQVDIEPTALGRFFPVALGIIGDAATVARQLTRALQSCRAIGDNTWLNEFQVKRQQLLAERDAPGQRSGEPIQPQAFFRILRNHLPTDTMMTLDAGTLCLQATDQFSFIRPPALFTPLDFGLVGFSYACGLGVKLACPERPVVSLMGDGGFGMTMGEIGTAVSHGINTVTIVMNNGCWGAEKAYQRDFFNGRYIGSDVPNPPYDKIAELFGAAGFRVDREADVAPIVAAALACGKPAIIDVAMDPDALYSFRRDSFQHRTVAGNA